jgi:hypothetical protein
VTTLREIEGAKRLVDIYCPQRHLIAVLVRNASLDPCLFVTRRGRAVPLYALTPDGFKGVMWADEETMSHLGDGAPSVLIRCRSCGVSLEAPASELGDKAKRAQGGRRNVSRMTAGVSSESA